MKEAYSAQDLQLFLQKLNPQIPDTTAPIIELIDEPSYVNVTADLTVGEAILDLSLAISLGTSQNLSSLPSTYRKRIVYPQNVTLITPPLTDNGTGQDKFDYLLEGLDASYCAVAAPKYGFRNFQSRKVQSDRVLVHLIRMVLAVGHPRHR